MDIEERCPNCNYLSPELIGEGCRECCTVCTDCDTVCFNEELQNGHCPECRKDYENCANCNALISRDALRSTTNDGNICGSCYSNGNYFCCDSCGEVYHGESYGSDGYCDSCYQERDDDSSWDDDCGRGSLLSYSYKPHPLFKGKGKRFFGFELEMNEIRDGNDAHQNSLWYFKKDGSISGQEWVSHPFTYDYLMSHKIYKTTMRQLYKEGGRAYNTSCGMHLHVTRPSDLQIAKICKLIYNNKDAFVEISERNAGTIDEWARFEGYYNNDTPFYLPKYVKSKKWCRNSAVNLCPDKTIEFRLFKGTLKWSRFLKNLQTVLSVMEFTDNVGYEDVCLSKWIEFCQSNRKRYKEMLTYFEEHYKFYAPYKLEVEEESIVNECV